MNSNCNSHDDMRAYQSKNLKKSTKWWQKLTYLSPAKFRGRRTLGLPQTPITPGLELPTPNVSPIPPYISTKNDSENCTSLKHRTAKGKRKLQCSLTVNSNFIRSSTDRQSKRSFDDEPYTPINRLGTGSILDGSLFVRHRSVSALYERKLQRTLHQKQNSFSGDTSPCSKPIFWEFDDPAYSPRFLPLEDCVSSKQMRSLADDLQRTNSSGASSDSSLPISNIDPCSPRSPDDILNAVSYNASEAIKALSLRRGIADPQSFYQEASSYCSSPGASYFPGTLSTPPLSRSSTPIRSGTFCSPVSFSLSQDEFSEPFDKKIQVIHFTGKNHVQIKPVTDVIISKSGRKFTRTRQEMVSPSIRANSIDSTFSV